jgi:hypothetical protein
MTTTDTTTVFVFCNVCCGGYLGPRELTAAEFTELRVNTPAEDLDPDDYTERYYTADHTPACGVCGRPVTEHRDAITAAPSWTTDTVRECQFHWHGYQSAPGECARCREDMDRYRAEHSAD